MKSPFEIAREKLVDPSTLEYRTGCPGASCLGVAELTDGESGTVDAYVVTNTTDPSVAIVFDPGAWRGTVDAARSGLLDNLHEVPEGGQPEQTNHKIIRSLGEASLGNGVVTN